MIIDYDEANEAIKSRETLSKFLGMKEIMSIDEYEEFIKTPVRSFAIRQMRIR